MTITLDLAALDSSTRRTLCDISLSVAKCKKILIVTGAGISCSSGIPDFRSSDGLYNLVKQRYPDVVLKGRDLFDASLFRDATSTAVFYTFISQLKHSVDSASPTATHRFIKTLDSKNKLLRSYTQNIDGLEAKAGLSASSECSSAKTLKGVARFKKVRNVQLHGDIHRVRCTSCAAEFPWTADHFSHFDEGFAPPCPECERRSNARVARSARPLKVGTLRPAIVLYDEPHPLGDEIGSIQGFDISRKPDMLIIMGTSLKVHGLKKLVKEFAKTVHNSTAPSGETSKPKKTWGGRVIFVNRTPPSSEWADVIDYHICGDTDSWTERVIKDWKKMRPADWEIQQVLVGADGDISMASPLKTVKDVSRVKEGKKNKKPQIPGRENVPPVNGDTLMHSPEVTTSSVGGGSPGKRRQTASHYSNPDASPSKKRTRSWHGPPLADDIRCLLFNSNTASQELGDVFDEDDQVGALAVDLSMHDINSPAKKPPRNLTEARKGERRRFNKTISLDTAFGAAKMRESRTDSSDVFAS